MGLRNLTNWEGSANESATRRPDWLEQTPGGCR